jgi:hypothetical protein
MVEYIAIDPGAHPGWAILNERLELVECGINQPPRRKFAVCFYEMQVIRPKDSPGIRKNILTLCVTTGKLVGPLEELGARLAVAEPSTWKGSVPKQIHHARILDKLTPKEQNVVSQCLKGVAMSWVEDAMDAIGLSQYAKQHGIFRP